MSIELAERQLQDAIEKVADRVMVASTSRSVVLVDYGHTSAEALNNVVAMAASFLTTSLRDASVKVGTWPKVKVSPSAGEGKPWRAEVKVNLEIL